MQGNIVAILDINGNIVVNYSYDAWGNYSVTGNETLGELNPYRYRGYYYDTETRLYYLQTRYYDPEIGRFISQDSVEYLDPEHINGLNLYAYCGNNPVMNIDPTGEFFWFIFLGAIAIGTIFGAVSGGVSAVQNGQSFWKGALIGGLTGLVTGAAFGLGGALGMAAFVAGTTVGLGVALGAIAGIATISFGAGIGINYLESQLYNTEFNFENALKFASILTTESVLSFGVGLLLGNKGYWPQSTNTFKGLFNKLIGSLKSTFLNLGSIIERFYLKNALLLPINIILNALWEQIKLKSQNN